MIRAYSLRGAGAGLLVFGSALLCATGCSRRATPPPPPSTAAAPADPAIVEMAPHLGEWIALWRRALPKVSLDSLRRFSSGPFTLQDIHHVNPSDREEHARLRGFGVFSPDSSRAVDPDAYLNVTRSDTGFSLERQPDSKALLYDLKVRSVATVEFCATRCAFDGAFWLDSLRFALTGDTTVNDSLALRCGRVRLYDLNAGTVAEYRLPSLPDREAYARFMAALDSALVARYRMR